MIASSTYNKRARANPVVNRETKVDADIAQRERQFLQEFPNDRACLDYLLRARFSTQIKCPKCARSAKFHKIRQIPAFACQWCGYHLHPMAQTRFARSRVGLRVWFHAVLLYSCGDNGISARELQRLLGLTYKTAWRMRNTIIDAKFNLPRHSKQNNRVEFEALLGALITPQPPARPKWPRRPRAA